MGNTKYALLVDGGFIIKKYNVRKRTFPIAHDIERICQDIGGADELSDASLFRTYFYHAPPATGKLTNPLDRSELNLGISLVFRNHEKLISSLEMLPSFAVRLGETVVRQWKLGPRAMESLLENPRSIKPGDLVPNIEQKQVDLRIGLDIAKLALQRLVDIVVVVTGDSDLIPAFKFARREGLQVYLCHLGHGVRRDLKVHTDGVIDTLIL
jgi:uncharacterized LabA/DUF88 family protein